MTKLTRSVTILGLIARAIMGTIGLAGVRSDAETWSGVLAEVVPRRWRWFLTALGISVGSGGVAVKAWGHTMDSWAWWELILLAVLLTSTVSGAMMAVYQYRENNQGGTIRRLKRLYPQMDRLLESLEKEASHRRPPRSLSLQNRIRVWEINTALTKEGVPTMGEPVNRDGFRMWMDFLANLMVEVERGDIETIRSLQATMLAVADRYVSPDSDILTP